MSDSDAVVTVKGCHSSEHKCSGYYVGWAGPMVVSSCISEGDRQGYHVEHRVEPTMEDVTVDSTLGSSPGVFLLENCNIVVCYCCPQKHLDNSLVGGNSPPVSCGPTCAMISRAITADCSVGNKFKH